MGPEFNGQKRSVPGGHNKAVHCTFLCTLRYNALEKTTSVVREEDQREKEREVLCENLFKIESGSDNDGNVIFDLPLRQTRTFEEFRYSSAIQLPENFEQDVIFKNADAKEAVDAMRGYLFESTEETIHLIWMMPPS